MEFDGTQKLIGRGAQADVFLYHGYAYKVYRPTYPAEWILFEMRQQRAVNLAGLSPVRYYETDDAHIIKMDLVEGDVIEKRAHKEPLLCFDLLGRAFRAVHEKKAEGVDMPRLLDTAPMFLTENERQIVQPLIERLCAKMESCVCHLDLHFLNIMAKPESSEFTIIDWMNARIAPPVFDYARTYVIFDEFSKEALEVYKDSVLSGFLKTGISDEDFSDAMKACAILRKHEKES